MKAPSAFLAAAAARLDAEEGEELLDHDAPTPPPVNIDSDQVLTSTYVAIREGIRKKIRNYLGIFPK